MRTIVAGRTYESQIGLPSVSIHAAALGARPRTSVHRTFRTAARSRCRAACGTAQGRGCVWIMRQPPNCARHATLRTWTCTEEVSAGIASSPHGVMAVGGRKYARRGNMPTCYLVSWSGRGVMKMWGSPKTRGMQGRTYSMARSAARCGHLRDEVAREPQHALRHKWDRLAIQAQGRQMAGIM